MGNYSIINTIRTYKDEVELRMTKLAKHTSEKFYYMPVEIMSEGWIIKSNIDWLTKWLEDSYYHNNEITRNQYKLVKAYLRKYEDDVWSRLYDIAAENSK